MDLNNKVIVIFGGAGRLGREFVNAVSKNGATVVIADIDEKAASRMVSKKVEFLKVDITSRSSVRGTLDRVMKKHKKIDAVVNTSYPRNKNYGRKLEDVTYDDFCENVDLHLGGYFLVSQQAAILFKKQGFGNVINLSSVYGVIAPRFEIYKGTSITMPVEYAAIKSAIILLTGYMANYFKGSGIRFNCISPGGILDGQSKGFKSAYKKFCSSKGMLDAKDIVGTLLFLLSEDSKYINGQNIIVDDGFTL